MQNQSKRKFTYLGQTYSLPEYFDCFLEIYAIESDPDIFRWYSKPTTAYSHSKSDHNLLLLHSVETAH